VVSAISGLVVGDSVTAENSATGVVTVLANSGTILEIKYSGTDFSETGGSNGLDKGTSYSVPGDTTITDEDTVTVATSTFSPAIDTKVISGHILSINSTVIQKYKLQQK